MNNTAKPDLETVFTAALALPSPEERAAYLEQACAGNEDLRRSAERLLNAYPVVGSFLEPPAADLAVTTDSPPISERPGTVIGPYKLLQQIGEGGMGVVFMAEQTEPLQRTVALKIIKPGMDTRQVIARFEAERQAVAMMDHPNIAKVLDAGATESGRPYFVMELVKGVPITKYCDEKHLPLRARLELFVQVCQAVQHAHQKGIIHRDIKPNNVLVAEYDNRAVPKVIDFGVAKATAQRLTEQTMFTEFGQVLGTMEYMSPEQSKFNQLDIDTRSDIYSLGVLLYELLAGSTPFEGKRLKEAAFDEMLRIIREEEPQKPSTRLSSIDTLPSVAANRQTEPARLSKDVRGELDWIVMKALEKDRNRRYETASGFAVDIERHLHDEPVEAGPPSAVYRFRKFAMRNKAPLITAGLLALMLLLGSVISTWQAVRATRAGQDAEAARESEAKLREQAEADKQTAQIEAAKSRQVAQFLKDMLQGVEPSVAVGRDTTVLQEILDKTAERIGKDLKDQPEVEAEIRSILGNTYRAIGKDAAAQPMHRQALAIYRRLYGNENPQVASLLNSLAEEVSTPDRHAEAEILEREALAMRRKLLGNEHPQVAESLDFLAVILLRQGLDSPEILKTKLDEAEKLEREALAIRRNVLGEEHVDVAQSLESLAAILRVQGKIDESEAMIRNSLAMRTKLIGNENLSVAASLLSLGDVLTDQRKYAEAESVYRKTLIMRRKLRGNEHPDVAIVLAHLAVLLQRDERLAEAETMNREALGMWRKTLGDRHPYVVGTQNVLAGILRDEGKLLEAESLFREALILAKNLLGNQQKYATASLNGLIDVLQRQGKTDEAENLRREAAESSGTTQSQPPP